MSHRKNSNVESIVRRYNVKQIIQLDEFIIIVSMHKIAKLYSASWSSEFQYNSYLFV